MHRRRHVAVHQRGGDRERVGIVVEAEPGQVAGQQLRAVDLQLQQVVHGLDVLGPVQAARGNPAGIGRGRRVQRRFERGQEALHRGSGGPRPPSRRHQPVAQLAVHLLEHFRVALHVADVEPFQGEPARPEPVAVAGDAVPVEQRAPI